MGSLEIKIGWVVMGFLVDPTMALLTLIPEAGHWERWHETTWTQALHSFKAHCQAKPKLYLSEAHVDKCRHTCRHRGTKVGEELSAWDAEGRGWAQCCGSWWPQDGGGGTSLGVGSGRSGKLSGTSSPPVFSSFQGSCDYTWFVHLSRSQFKTGLLCMSLLSPFLHLINPSSLKTLLTQHCFKEAPPNTSRVWIRSVAPLTVLSSSTVTLNPLHWNWLPTRRRSQEVCGVLKRGSASFILIFWCLVPSKYAVDVCCMNEWVRIIGFFSIKLFRTLVISNPSSYAAQTDWISISCHCFQLKKKTFWKYDVQL